MESKQHVCPWWAGYFLINPLRKLFQDPYKILTPFITPGMKIVDYGSAMGYFSLPLAKITGNSGKVYCMDIQQKMLGKLVERAGKARLGSVIEPVLIDENMNYSRFYDQIDFAALFMVVHEVPDKGFLFKQLFNMLKSGSSMLIAEPRGHVSMKEFEQSVNLAIQEGFKKGNPVKVSSCRGIVLIK